VETENRVSTRPVQRSGSKFSFNTCGGFAAIVLWSTSFAIARSLSEHVGPLTAGASAYLIGGGFCLLRLWGAKTSIRSLGSLSRRYLNLTPGPKLWVGCLLLVTGSLLSWISVSDRPEVHRGQPASARL